MIKTYCLFIYSLFLTQMCFGQVGININTPKATLDVVKSNQITFPDGIIPPVLTRAEVISKNDYYDQDQKGAYIYVNEIGTESTTQETQKIVTPGYYYFDGSIWQSFSKKSIYYLPSFNLPLTNVANNFTYDLYTNVYKSQFTKANNSKFFSSNSSLNSIPGLLNASQIDFVVTYYDDSVIKVNSISATGVLNYDVLNTNPCGITCTTTPCKINPCTSSYINVILIEK
jgi:hypothetical protein